MPLERISRGFKDLSLSFKANPLSKDLNTIQNEVAISRAIRNLVLTYRQERFFNPQLGTGVSKLLFENMTPVVSELIRDEITRVINNYEPRVELSNVIVTPIFDNNEYNIQIQYKIVGIEPEQRELSFVLLSTR